MALGLALIEHGHRVLFTRTTDLTHRLQRAHGDLALEQAIAKLDKFHLVILDDFALRHQGSGADQRAVRVDPCPLRAPPAVADRQPAVRQWDTIFSDRAMTVAAVDRLVHRAAIFELNVDSYRRRTAVERQRRQEAPPTAAEPPAKAPPAQQH